MMRTSRLLTSLALGCATVIGVTNLSPVFADDQAAPAPAPAAPAASDAEKLATPEAVEATPSGALTVEEAAAAPVDPLRVDVEDFWHYGKIGRYDQAAPLGQKILDSGRSDIEILQALEAVASDRQDDIYNWLLKWQQLDEMKDVATKLLVKVHDGTNSRVNDPAYIMKQIRRLATNRRAYILALGELRRSGELCVPLMIDVLRDPAQKQYHAAIRSALVDLGRQALNPLVAATEMADQDTCISILEILGSIGYEAAEPYLAKLATGADTPAPIKDAAGKVLMRMGVADPGSVNAAKMFYDLGEKFYYNNASIAVDRRNPVAYLWTWDEPNGRLKPTEVPPEIFNDVMAMRSCEYALKLDNTMADGVALWLASNYKREADLPEGTKDPSRPDGYPSAHYWGMAYGTQYLEKVVDRALRDRNSAVALRSIKSLGEIAGQANLYTEDHQPMIDALRYPDRLVRFEAAFALANGLPQKSFGGQERVVPMLADALQQTGKPNALLIAASQDQYNTMAETLKAGGYTVQGGTSPEAAIAGSNSLPGVDAIVISEKLSAEMMDHTLTLLSQNARLERVPRVFIIVSVVSPYAAESIDDPLTNVVKADDPAALVPAVNAARTRSGSLPLDDKMATDYAIRGADMLAKLAISRGQVLDLMVAQTNLLGALDDARPEVIQAAGKVLGLLDSKEAQTALLTKAADDKTPDDVKVTLFKAVATSAKFFGDKLDSGNIDTLQKVVETAANLDVRTAAAQARGALNLPAPKVQPLIVDQSSVPFISGH